MEAKERVFVLADILTIFTGRFLSSDFNHIYTILNFMTNDNLFTHQLPRAMDQCRPHLLAQFPWLDSPEMKRALAELDNVLNHAADKAAKEAFIGKWLSKVSRKYGHEHLVSPIPPGDYQHQNPILELVEKVGRERVIVVLAPEPD